MAWSSCHFCSLFHRIFAVDSQLGLMFTESCTSHLKGFLFCFHLVLTTILWRSCCFSVLWMRLKVVKRPGHRRRAWVWGGLPGDFVSRLLLSSLDSSHHKTSRTGKIKCGGKAQPISSFSYFRFPSRSGPWLLSVSSPKLPRFPLLFFEVK